METLKETQSRFTVIIADDEPSILNGLKDSFDWKQLGITVCGLAGDGRAALNMLLRERPDIAIIDIKMPEMDGLEVIRRARAADVSTDFIILSGYDDFSYARDAIHYGAKAYLLKPLNKQELYDELLRICRERSKEDHVGRANSDKTFDRQFFTDLIESKILDSRKITETLLSMDVTLCNGPCYVLVLSYEDIPQSTLSAPAKNHAEPDLTDPISLMEAELIHYRHVLFNYDETKIVGIFNTSDTTPFQSAMQCLEILERNRLTLPLIGVGDTVSGLFECSYSYNRALTALTYELYDDHSRIFTSELICTVPPSITLSDIDYLPLMQDIVQKNTEGIRSWCNDFIDTLLYVKMPPPNYVFSLCYALFNQIEQEFSHFSGNDITPSASAGELYQFKKLSQIREWLTDSFCQLAEYVDAVYGYSKNGSIENETAYEEVSAPEPDKDQIICTAKEYIRDNIGNRIKIEDIARQVHLSPSYFAIYFKNKTNVNLRDYLLNEKMEYAKRKLKDPAASVTDVAYEIGYGDYRSFSRAFKNVCGMTPSDYQAGKACRE